MASPLRSLHARGFASDPATERALRAGLADREARIERSRFDIAIRTLAAEPSAQLVFVDLDGVPEPEAAARELTAVCAFGTALIAIGSADTAHLTRALLREGIADYLVKPISPAAVREASAVQRSIICRSAHTPDGLSRSPALPAAEYPPRWRRSPGALPPVAAPPPSST